MTFIDWSDPEEMIGLLTEYVTDARNDAGTDPARASVLTDLLSDLNDLTRGSGPVPLDEAIAGLSRIRDSRFDDLAGDAVLAHVEDCIAELERIRAEGGV